MTKKQFKRLLFATLVVVTVAVLLIAIDEASGKTRPCSLGQFCITHGASRNSAKSGQVIFFSVKLKNNLNFALKDVTLRYTVPRQVVVRQASAGYQKVGDDQLRWKFPPLEPGTSWSVKVKVLVLSYAPKRVANRATVFIGSEKRLELSLPYKIADSAIS